MGKLEKVLKGQKRNNVFLVTETHHGGNCDTPDCILKDLYQLYDTQGPNQKGQENQYNRGIALLVKADVFDINENVLLQNRHQIKTWQ